MELISIKDMPNEVKIKLLEELGYKSDGQFVLFASGDRVKDRYINVDVKLSNMLIFPGSIIILDNNPLSIASYMEEHPDEF